MAVDDVSLVNCELRRLIIRPKHKYATFLRSLRLWDLKGLVHGYSKSVGVRGEQGLTIQSFEYNTDTYGLRRFHLKYVNNGLCALQELVAGDCRRVMLVCG